RVSIGPFAHIKSGSTVDGDVPSYAPALSGTGQKNTGSRAGKPRKSVDGRTNSKNKRRKDR
ncbi:MAG: hypothetical protein VST72_03505, partial [Nitrospirota bacterium]|nr:hypothetical protein [Nitrospirota bacterium]